MDLEQKLILLQLAYNMAQTKTITEVEEIYKKLIEL